VSIQFSEIHNLVRTYQRVLKLESGEPVQPPQPLPKHADRVSISRQARELKQAAIAGQKPPEHEIQG
jgi:hypothetical protein